MGEEKRMLNIAGLTSSDSVAKVYGVFSVRVLLLICLDTKNRSNNLHCLGTSLGHLTNNLRGGIPKLAQSELFIGQLLASERSISLHVE